MRKRQPRAIALISVLLFSVLLLVLTLTVVRGSSLQSQGATAHAQSVSAAYLAEAGLARAISTLQAAPGWTAGFPHESGRWGQGTYHLQFSSGPSFAADDSINNLLGTGPADGPKGPGSVPAHCAYLVISGQSGMTRRSLEALVGPRTLQSVGGPLLAEGPIHLEGHNLMDGIESYGGPQVQVQVHSNFGGQAGLPTIFWQALQPTDRLVVAGNLTAVDARPPGAVFSLNGSYSVASQLASQAKIAAPDINIPAQVASHSGAPPASLSGGTTVLGPGDHYLSGDTSYAGNIVLSSGANLYVGGDLDLTGSVTGTGSVFSSGNVSLSGSAQVSSGNRVALAAQGNVTLQGFDGNQYLRSLPGGTTIVNDIKRVQQEMDNLLADPTVTPSYPMSWTGAPSPLPPWALAGKVLGNWGALDRLNASLGGEYGDDPPYFSDVAPNRVGALVSLVDAQPDSSQKTFVLSQLTALKTFTRWNSPATSLNKEQRRDQFLANPSLDQPLALDGLFDTLGDLSPAQQMQGLHAVRDLMSNFSIDRLGDAHFEGVIYARGSIVARNEINVRGGLVAAGDDQSKVRFESGSNLTYIKDFFGRGEEAVVFGGGLSIRHWYLR